jgi:N6-adenosine-specific RNA methylase IME4
MGSEWRKPWEKLIIAKRAGAATPPGLKSKTIIAVPDLHSRKPSVQRLFAECLPPQYLGLEVFARNLTAGWWSWGDDVLKFQQNVHWTLPDDADRPVASQLQ